jgi:PAS domain S-box-containing protein
MRPGPGERGPAREHAPGARSGIDPVEAARIVGSAIDAIVSGDPDGTIRSWNAGAQRLYGYAAEEMIGRPFTYLVPSRDLPRGNELHQHVLTGEPLPEFEA